MSNHSTYYKKALQKYSSGAWTKTMLKVLVEKGLLTEEEYYDITGYTY